MALVSRPDIVVPRAAARPAVRDQMDGLRGIFAVSVVLFHAFKLPQDMAHLVRFFFILSSFLLTLGLLRDREQGLLEQIGFWRTAGRFWRRRALRTLPPYFALLGVLLAFDAGGIRQSAWWHLTFTSNMLFALEGTWQPWHVAHFWTLAVEEQFYLFWPFAMLLLPWRWFAVALAAMGVAPLVWKVSIALSGATEQLLLTPTWAALDGFALGAALAVIVARGGDLPRRVDLWLMGATVVVGLLYAALIAGVGPSGNAWRYGVLDTLQLLPLGFVLLRITFDGFGYGAFLLGFPPLVWLGRISYGIYLVHLPIMITLIEMQLPFLWTLALGVVLTIGAAKLSWHLIEVPASRLRPKPLDLPVSR